MEIQRDPPYWFSRYKDREISLQDLSTIIPPGSRIYIGSACSEPIFITKELIQQKSRWIDCEIIHLLTLSNLAYFSEEHPSQFRHNALSILGSPQMREAVNSGKSDYTPIRTFDIPKKLKNRAIPIDIAFLQVSLPDQYGYCSLGINVDINHTVAQMAKILVFQVNSQVPFTQGNTVVKFDQCDYFLHQDYDLLEYTLSLTPTEEERMDKIGGYLARLIENESTLNVGLGKWCYHIWKYLVHKQDLAIYSEILGLTPAFWQLIENDIITCLHNPFYPHIMTSFALGTKADYQRLHHNPFFEFHATEFLNDPVNIARNHKICSIYGAIAVDLNGQISNHLEQRFHSGIGGELDFITGTSLAEGGKTIFLLPSTTHDGKISRIVPIIRRASVLSCDVHYVVTEWGIARLAGKSIRERALQLIGIAHPDFRKELLQAAKNLHYIYEDQIIPLTRDGIVVIYPEQYEWQFPSKSLGIITFRPIKPTDEPLLQRFFYQLKAEDRFQRFLNVRKIFSHEDTQLRVNIDYDKSMMLVGLLGEEDRQEIVCASSYYRDPSGSTNLAEIAITVGTEIQNQGLGKHLFNRMIEIAQEKGVAGFCGDINLDNAAIVRILRSLQYKITFQHFEMLVHFTFYFDSEAERIPSSIISEDPFMQFKNPIE